MDQWPCSLCMENAPVHLCLYQISHNDFINATKLDYSNFQPA